MAQNAEDCHKDGGDQDLDDGTARRAVPNDRIFLRERGKVSPAISHRILLVEQIKAIIILHIETEF